jgi:hypothetical protein
LSPSLQSPHRLIVIDGDNEDVRFTSGGFEVTGVTDVEQVETAVREGNGAAPGSIEPNARDEFVPRENFTHEFWFSSPF